MKILFLFIILLSGFCHADTSAQFDIQQLKLSDSPQLTELLKNTPEAVRGEAKFLPVDEAFKLSVRLDDSHKLNAFWQIADGYYLYRKKFNFRLNHGGQLGAVQMPAGEIKNDPTYGETEVYHRVVEINIPVTALNDLKNLDISISYQGCADSGLCYPPTEKTFSLPISNTFSTTNNPIVTQTTAAPQPTELSETDQIIALLQHASFSYILVIFFGFGLLLAFTPCVFPMIPILSSIIVGQGNKLTTSRAFTLSLIYVLAMALTYAVAGVIAGLIGENIQIIAQNSYILISFALIFVFLSLSMFGFYELQLPSSLQTHLTQVSNRQQGGNLFGVAIMGILSALIVGPCVAAPLAGALIYIGHTGNALLGGLALFFMGLGMGAPLLIVGVSAGHLLPKSGSWMTQVKSIFGVILLGVAIWMIERVIPPSLTLLLWAMLLIVSAIFLGALDNLADTKNPSPLPHDWHTRHHTHESLGWLKFRKSVGIILLIYGILLMVGAASGGTNPLQPLKNLSLNQGVVSKIAFQTIRSENLKQALEMAGQQPILVDIYADWCISCKELEHVTFADAGVQQLLQQFKLLRVDVTANNVQDKALYQQFSLVGPPVVMFFNAGTEQKNLRVVGFMNAAQFQVQLQKVLTALKPTTMNL